MRIIAGTRRGMNLLPPKGGVTRPITDRAKEALFSVLYKYGLIEDGVVADLFCGTGSLGLECLSRGARWVTFVDNDTAALERLKRNIAKARFTEACRVMRANALSVGAPWPDAADRDMYDLIFVDPPYRLTYETGAASPLGRLLDLLAESVRSGGLVVVRTHRRSRLSAAYGVLDVVDRRQWGTTAVTLLERASTETPSPEPKLYRSDSAVGDDVIRADIQGSSVEPDPGPVGEPDDSGRGNDPGGDNAGDRT